MQARWGTHGDYTAIAVAPSSVGDTITETIRAFNLAERFRTPVTILLDEVIGHMREMVTLPEPGEYPVVDRVRPTVAPDKYAPFELTANLVSPMAAYNEGYRFNVTGLTHDPMGFSTNRADEIAVKLDKLKYKIERYTDEITKLRVDMMDDAEIAFISYGTVARTALQATAIAREAGVKVGNIQLYTIWPFPDKQIAELCARCKKVIVGELNMGQIVHEVRRILPHEKQVHTIQRYDGEILTPHQLLEKLDEVL
jgi:2-oxoglutarate ferredoxin oxidoreductase subunit alpha